MIKKHTVETRKCNCCKKEETVPRGVLFRDFTGWFQVKKERCVSKKVDFGREEFDFCSAKCLKRFAKANFPPDSDDLKEFYI